MLTATSSAMAGADVDAKLETLAQQLVGPLGQVSTCTEQAGWRVQGHQQGDGTTMATSATADSIDAYIAGFSPATQALLEELRALVKASAPGATETISYGIPTFDLNGRHLVHFAGFAKHLGFYPVPSGLEAFEEALVPYKRGKGSVQFPTGQPLPADLIRRIVEFRVQENLNRAST